MYNISLEFDGPRESYKGMAESLQIVFHSEEVFDFNYPFRSVINKVVEQLVLKGRQARVDKLPEYHDSEDFIQFNLAVDEEVLSGYFEQSLGYLSFASDSEVMLEFVKSACHGCSFSSIGYGVVFEKMF